MPERSERRARRDPPASIPQTLSLPIIPSHLQRPDLMRNDPEQDEAPPRRKRTAKGKRAGDTPEPSRKRRAQRADENDDEDEWQPPQRAPASYPMRALTPYGDASWEDSGRTVGSVRDDMVPMIPDTQEMIAMTARSRALISVPAKNGSLTLPRPKRAAPPRSIKRGFVWQGLLLGIMLATFFTSLHGAGEAPGAANAFAAYASAQHKETVAMRVPTFIQIDPTIGYDSSAQYHTYANADCGAAATAEVLTAWGDPHGNIGHVIDDMTPDGSLTSAGMLNYSQAFKDVASKEHFNLVLSSTATAAQLAEIVTNQGIPVIIGVRDTTGGYYQYFAPGHFLVVTGADANGFDIVDSSTYFVHYLPTATFMQLWDQPRAAIFTPPSYSFQMP